MKQLLPTLLTRRKSRARLSPIMEKEPPGSSPLFGRDNIIATPHTSFYSKEPLVDLQTKAAQEVVRVIDDLATLSAPRSFPVTYRERAEKGR